VRSTPVASALDSTPLAPSPRMRAMPLSRRFPIVAALTLLVCAACGGGEPTAPGAPATQAAADSAFVASLRARLEAAAATDEFSGAVLVARDGHTLFEGAYGLADRERGVANTPLTQFRVGSMDKMLTAVAVLQLVQAGKVRLDTPLGTYLPDYPNAEMASKVTLHHLLTHTGGTGDIFGPEFAAHRSELRTIGDYLRLYGTRSLRFTPGTQWEYSNYGFLLNGAVIERVGGASYYDQVAARVLAPAGMTATGFAPEDSLVPGRSVGYTRQLVPGALVSNAPTLPYRGTPAGGGYSTVEDFARFAVAVRERRLLDSAHTTLLLAGKVEATGLGAQYAYGFIDRVVHGRRFVGHSGGAAGMSGDLEFEPNGGYVVVVLSNFDSPAAIQVSAFILDHLPTSTPAGGGASAARSAPMPARMRRSSRKATALR
jgi:D-alanyl-D-alanine carboxypeptidase